MTVKVRAVDIVNHAMCCGRRELLYIRGVREHAPVCGNGAVAVAVGGDAVVVIIRVATNVVVAVVVGC